MPGERGQAYDDIIDEHSRTHGVRPDLVKAVMQVESAFNQFARSPKGALGLMQLMPATIRQYSVKNPFDPAENVRGGVAYLRHLLDRYENNETLALAAYNAGPGAVDKYRQTVPPYRETRNYVAQISKMTSRPIAMRDKTIYKVTDTVDGRSIVRYTDKKPTAGTVEVVGSTRLMRPAHRLDLVAVIPPVPRPVDIQPLVRPARPPPSRGALRPR